MTNIIIPDKEKFEKKVEIILNDGANNLHIISDFDRTLTKAFMGGEKLKSAYAFIREGNYLTPDYPKKAFALFDKYHPYEISTEISFEEKKKWMQEWWETHLELLINSGMSIHVIKDIMNKGKVDGREGLHTFFKIIKEKQIPLLIFSAGIGNFITEFLKYEKIEQNNLHIIANFFKFDETGKATGYESDIIHVFNKNEQEIKNHPYTKGITERKNVILLGDGLGDVNMAEGLEHKIILKIGFLNHDIEKQLEEYSKHYDLLILNDGNMEEINKILTLQ